MTDSDLYNLVHDIITAVTGLANDHVIPADDNEESPDDAYASIKIGSSRGQRGQANITKSNTGLVTSPIGQVYDINHDIKAQITVDVSINFYRGGALENAVKMFQANKLPTISGLLFTANVGWKGANAINDLTALQSKEREERSQITITLLYEQTQSEITNAIYSVEVIAENENGDTIQTETMEAPVELLPPQLPGLKLWNRFNKGITVAGSGVSQWDDQSGNGNHLLQIADANRPTLEADGTILFDGISQFLKTAGFILEQPETIYLLCKQVTWTNGRYIFDGNTQNSSILRQKSGGVSPQLEIYAGGVFDAIAPVLDTYGIFTTIFDGVSSLSQLDNDAPITGNGGGLDMNGFTLAAAGGTGTTSNIQVKEVIIFNASHDAETTAKVVNYLQNL